MPPLRRSSIVSLTRRGSLAGKVGRLTDRDSNQRHLNLISVFVEQRLLIPGKFFAGEDIIKQIFQILIRLLGNRGPSTRLRVPFVIRRLIYKLMADSRHAISPLHNV
jgi:hypothetical protein